MRAKTAEIMFYRATFDAVAEGLTGARTPVVPLDRKRWRWMGALVMVLLGGASFGGAMATADHADLIRAEAGDALVRRDEIGDHPTMGQCFG